MPPRSSMAMTASYDDDSCLGPSSSVLKPARLAAHKSVDFASQNESVDHLHINDYTPEDIANTWFDPDEYAEMKEQYQFIIFLMDSDKDPEDETRGLEYRTQQGAWDRYENKRDAYNAVLDEQDRQWKFDRDDVENLSRVYQEVSSKCLEAARLRGAADQDAVQEYLKTEPLLKIKKKKKVKGDKLQDVKGEKTSSSGKTKTKKTAAEKEEKKAKKKDKEAKEKKKVKKEKKDKESSKKDKTKEGKESSSKKDKEVKRKAPKRTSSSRSTASVRSRSSSGSSKSHREKRESI